MSAPDVLGTDDASRSELPRTTETELEGREVAHQMCGDGHAHELEGSGTGMKELDVEEVLRG